MKIYSSLIIVFLYDLESASPPRVIPFDFQAICTHLIDSVNPKEETLGYTIANFTVSIKGTPPLVLKAPYFRELLDLTLELQFGDVLELFFHCFWNVGFDTGSNRNLATNDHVLFESVEMVGTTVGSGVDQHASRVLE